MRATLKSSGLVNGEPLRKTGQDASLGVIKSHEGIHRPLPKPAWNVSAQPAVENIVFPPHPRATAPIWLL